MTTRAYSALVAGLSITCLTAVALVNFVVDPGAIYLTKYLSQSEADLYARTATTTPYGLLAKGWNPRDVKMAFAKIAGRFDCAIVGSSRIMFVSSHRAPNDVAPYCQHLVNLGVPGAGIEDITIFVYTMLSEQQLPRQVFLAIDPWTFQFDSDAQWKVRSDVYDRAVAAFRGEQTGSRASYASKLAANLVNLEYFQESWKRIRDTGVSQIVHDHRVRYANNRTVQETRLRPLVVDQLDYVHGRESNVTLPDGSMVPSRSYLEDPDRAVYDNGYKVWDERIPAARRATHAPDPKAVALLTALSRVLRDAGTTVSFVLVPYSFTVWDDPRSMTAPVLDATAAFVHELGRTLGVRVIGSYRPTDMGCARGDFYDFMHPLDPCLARIFRTGTR